MLLFFDEIAIDAYKTYIIVDLAFLWGNDSKKKV